MPNGPRDLPCQVTEVRTHRSTSYLAVEFLKFFCPITESKELHGARKGVKRVKEEHNISSFVVRQTDIFELTIWHNGCSFELRSRMSNFHISWRHIAISSSQAGTMETSQEDTPLLLISSLILLGPENILCVASTLWNVFTYFMG